MCEGAMEMWLINAESLAKALTDAEVAEKLAFDDVVNRLYNMA